MPNAGVSRVAEWPFYGLAILAPISFCLGTASPTTVKLLIICALAVPILVLLCRRICVGPPTPKSALLFPAVAVFVWKAVSAAYGGHLYSSAEPLANATLYLIFFLGAYSLRRQERLLHVLAALAYGTIPVAVVGVLEHYGVGVPRLSDATLGRAYSTMGNPTFLAAYLALLLPLQVGLFCIAERKTQRWTLAASASLSYLCIIFTYTRGIWIGLIVAALAMALLAARSNAKELITARRNSLAALAIVFLVITALAWGLRPSTADVHNQANSTKFAVRESDTIRKTLMGAGVAMFKQRPVLGWGLGGYKAYQLNFIASKPVPGKYDMGEDHPHNDLIETAADQGLPGLVIYVWLLAGIGLSIAAALRRARQDADPARALVVVALAGGVIAFFADVMVNVSIHEVYVGVFFWLALGVLAYQQRRGSRIASIDRWRWLWGCGP